MVVVRYAQAPMGWWQDSKRQMQPPGSFLSPSLRVGTDQPPDGVVPTVASTHGRLKKWTAAIVHGRA